MQCRPPDRRRIGRPARRPPTRQTTGRPARRQRYRPRQTTTKDNRRQPAKQYWPIRRASDKTAAFTDPLSVFCAMFTWWKLHRIPLTKLTKGIWFWKDPDVVCSVITPLFDLLATCNLFSGRPMRGSAVHHVRANWGSVYHRRTTDTGPPDVVYVWERGIPVVCRSIYNLLQQQ